MSTRERKRKVVSDDFVAGDDEDDDESEATSEDNGHEDNDDAVSSDASEDTPKAKPKKEKSSSKKDKKAKKEKRSKGSSKSKSSKKTKEVTEAALVPEEAPAPKKVRIELKRAPKPAKPAAAAGVSAKAEEEPIGEEVTVRALTSILLIVHQGTHAAFQAPQASTKAAHVEKSQANSQGRAISSRASSFTDMYIAKSILNSSALDENISAPPSLLPAKKYCDVTGLPAPYTDPRTKMRFTNVDIYRIISAMTDERVQQHLGARGATYHTRSTT